MICVPNPEERACLQSNASIEALELKEEPPASMANFSL